MVDNYLLFIDRDLEDSVFNMLMDLVTKEKRERIQRFCRYEDKQRTLLGDIMARSAICRKTGFLNSKLIFGSNEYGKPLLLSPDGTHFNISHSGKWVACALHDKPIGVDVEEFKQIDISLAGRFFSQEEYIDLQAQPEEMKLKYFYMLWTLKESFIKAEGKGLSIPLKSFTVKIHHENASVKTENDHKIHCFCKQFFLDNSHTYAVCTYNNDLCKTHLLTTKNISDFIDILL